MRLILAQLKVRYALIIAVCIGVAAGALSFDAYTQQTRSVADAVYSDNQAKRGQQTYQAQCAVCHGDAMEGASGPPLVGGYFQGNWSGRTLAELVEKTQLTMPFGNPNTLSRRQTIDLVAYMLQGGKHPAGEAELADANLSQIGFPVVSSAAASPTPVGGVPAPVPEGNLSEVMRAIHFPASNVIFNLQLKNPTDEPKKDITGQPFDYVEWGSTIYAGWLAVDQAAVAIVETSHLLLTPGRRCQNGKLAPVDREDWKRYVQEMIDVGKVARRAAQQRNYPAFVEISEKLNDSCANCHKVYRDKGGTEGSGQNRCE
jgi:mono/diheme cytochrome c family protein